MYLGISPKSTPQLVQTEYEGKSGTCPDIKCPIWIVDEKSTYVRKWPNAKLMIIKVTDDAAITDMTVASESGPET